MRPVAVYGKNNSKNNLNQCYNVRTDKVLIHNASSNLNPIREVFMAKYILTQKQLKAHLHYNPETGLFTRINNNPSKSTSDYAGSLHNKGYIMIYVLYDRYRAHRLAWLYMTGKMPTAQIDHIDGNKANNAFDNLRQASNKENLKNRTVNSNNKSGYRGVSWSNSANKWLANAMHKGKRKNLGYFDTAEKAYEAFKAFAKKHYGEFYNMV